ncbi:hypothetical protein FOA52_012747 [Chlamydomonas sp. UWO 241]|nr:hypothetical protein FOA52_012747 [Chlamydomonas sp. UWO 241]
MQLTGAKGVLGWALDRLCGAGKQSHEEVMNDASAVTVAWLQAAFRPGAETDAGLSAFRAWAARRADRGALRLEEKTGVA